MACFGVALLSWPAAAQVTLGTAQSFAVLASSTVTNTGPTIVSGNLGISPGSALTGFPPGLLTGAEHITDAVALQAEADATTAFNTLAGSACSFDLTGQDLGGLTLLPGVYCLSSSAQLTGALTLDALGSSAASFVFKIGSTLTTASGSTVTVINGGTGCNVFWQVGSSATLGTTTSFVGTIIAGASVTLDSGTSVLGRVIALTGAVTLDANSVSIPIDCQNVVTYGTGCVGSSGQAPVLSMDTPIPGFITTLTLEGGLPGSTAIIFIGGPASHLTNCGCELLVRPGPAVLTLQLSGTGSAMLSGQVPAGLSGSFSMQAFVIDPTASCGYSNSNAITVSIN